MFSLGDLILHAVLNLERNAGLDLNCWLLRRLLAYGMIPTRSTHVPIRAGCFGRRTIRVTC